MEKAISEHKKYIESQAKKDLTRTERDALARYHEIKVHDFQHERLVHLLVTFFFAVLFIAALTAFLTVPVTELRWLLCALTILLFGLEAAYVHHYYKLENGVQSLYTLTDTLSKR